MNQLRFTMLTDGSSDKALIPIIHWLLSQHYPNLPLDGVWADLARFPSPPKDFAEKIATACIIYPCDFLFIHRDAEKEARDVRVEEIQHAVEDANKILVKRGPQQLLPGYACVIPVRMMEAWLLFDIEGIRKAAANPNGKIPLQLPSLKQLESIPDPKKMLHELLRSASELKGRKLRIFRPQLGVHRLADYIDDFSPLRELLAFQKFEEEVKAKLHDHVE